MERTRRRKEKNGTRESLMASLALAAVLFVLPLLTVAPVRKAVFEGREPSVEELPPFESGVRDGECRLRVLDSGEVTEMDLGAYLVGVLRAEMPASFPAEALKAQAVAGRTYTIYQLRQGARHETADICTDHTCCQAYLGEEEAWSRWGEDAADYETKIRSAVQETDGEVILYDAQPILAVFHSASAGLTRGAGEVWMSDLPYLQAVESPEKEESIPDYFSRAEFSAEEVKEKFLAAYPEMDFSAPCSQWLTEAATDSAGSVVTVSVGGMKLKGAHVRNVLGLRSACFDWEIQDGKFVFYVTGYGHGVGMSQYGAAAMAEEGATWREILQHYYSGVEIGPCAPP